MWLRSGMHVLIRSVILEGPRDADEALYDRLVQVVRSQLVQVILDRTSTLNVPRQWPRFPSIQSMY